MRIIIGSAGSRGDVMPILEVASALHRRGHDLKVFVPGEFAANAAARGLDVEHFATDQPGLDARPR